jgi:hypothetical protein
MRRFRFEVILGPRHPNIEEPIAHGIALSFGDSLQVFSGERHRLRN